MIATVVGLKIIRRLEALKISGRIVTIDYSIVKIVETWGDSL